MQEQSVYIHIEPIGPVLFEKSTKRGLSGYAKLVLQEYFKYKPFSITINYRNNTVSANPPSYDFPFEEAYKLNLPLYNA